MPREQHATFIPQPPAVPQSADDLIDVAVAHLAAEGIHRLEDITPAIRTDLVTLMQSYPAAASVAQQGDSLVVTDQAGAEAELVLLAPPQLSAASAVRGQQDLAASWSELLQSGGVLMVAQGATVEVSPVEAEAFLTALLAAFAAPPEERLAKLDALIG